MWAHRDEAVALAAILDSILYRVLGVCAMVAVILAASAVMLGRRKSWMMPRMEEANPLLQLVQDQAEVRETIVVRPAFINSCSVCISCMKR